MRKTRIYSIPRSIHHTLCQSHITKHTITTRLPIDYQSVLSVTPKRFPFPPNCAHAHSLHSCTFCPAYDLSYSHLLSSILLSNERIKLQRLINDLDTPFPLLKNYGIIMILTRTQWLAFDVSLKIFHFPYFNTFLQRPYFELQV